MCVSPSGVSPSSMEYQEKLSQHHRPIVISAMSITDTSVAIVPTCHDLLIMQALVPCVDILYYTYV